MTFYFDTETRSPLPINQGTDKYTRACEPIIATWAFDDEPVRIWERGEPLPEDLRGYLCSSDGPIIAHNASFDYGVVTYGFGIETDVRRWRCTRAQAYAHGLPGALELLGTVLGLPLSDRKSSEGTRLIQTFCVPTTYDPDYLDAITYNEPHDRPDDWLKFLEYAKQDTHTLRRIHRRLPAHNYRGEALDFYALDQICNWRGFRFDKPLALAARHLLELAKERHGKEISEATAGAVGAATQRNRLLAHLRERYKLALPDMRAATIRDYLEQDDIEPGLRFLLEARLEAAKNSGAKYGRGLSLVGPQDRLRHTHQCWGAGRTGRDSHKGFQPGNMARPTQKAEYIDSVVIPSILDGSAIDAPDLVGGPNTACANALRGAIIAAPGNELIDADFSNIESRVLSWLAAEHTALGRYRAGEDLYKLWYAEKFGIPVEEVTFEQRQIAKVVALSMGFLGAVGAFVPMAAAYNLDLDSLPPLVLPNAPERQLAKAEKAWERAFLKGEDFELEREVYMACDILKQAYREGNANIFETGHQVGQAVIDALKSPGSAYEVARCKIWATGTALLIQLPDASRLTYFAPKLHRTVETDPVTGKETAREHTTYMTARGKQWYREKAWAGLYWNNITQATANRLLRAAMLRIHEDTLTVPAIAVYLSRLPAHARTAIVLRIHDSITLDVPKGSYPLSRMIEQMNILPPWAKGLPVATEGWVNERYGKH